MLEIAKSAIVCTLLGNLVSSALDILLSNSIKSTSTLVLPVSDTVHWLRALLIGALLKLVLEWASKSIVGSRNGDPVGSASLVVVIFLFVEAFTVSIPSTNAINRLSAAAHSALHIAVSVWASVATVGSSSFHCVRSASRVLVCLGVISTVSIVVPSSQAIHWLGAALSGALLVSVLVWASITVVGHIDTDGIGPASPVLVVIGIVEASSVRSPVSNTVNRLRATFSGALDLLVLKWTLLAIQDRFGRDLVGSALLILVLSLNMLASIISSPRTFTINRLSASNIRALRQTVLVWAVITIVKSNLALNHTVSTAALICMIFCCIFAVRVISPSSNTVNRLGAALSGALLQFILVWTRITIMGRSNRDLVESAPFVDVCFLVMEALSILIPSSNTVHGLDAKLSAALNIAISVWALVSTVGRGSFNLVGSALLVLVRLVVILACVILTPSSQAIHRLGAALSGALLVSVGIWASKTIVSSIDSDCIGPASPVLVVLVIVEAGSVRSPVSNTVNRLATAVGGALDLHVLNRTLLATQRCFCNDLVGSAALILVTISNVVAAGVQAPLTLTIHRLATSALGALNSLLLKWTSIFTVESRLANHILATLLILVITFIVGARGIVTPCANTVHRLRAAFHCTGLVVVCISASITVVSSILADLVEPAAPVLVVIVVLARSIWIPRTNTINRLRATRCRALLKVVSIRTAIPVVRGICGDLVVSAPPVLVVLGVMEAGSVWIPCTNAIWFVESLVMCLQLP